MFVLLAFVAVGVAITVVFLRRGVRSYQELSGKSLERLWPPLWPFLVFVPWLGHRWLERMLETSERAFRLNPPQERMFTQDEQVPWGESSFFLFEEQHDHATGEDHGVRIQVLKTGHMYTLISHCDPNQQAHPLQEIEVATPRALRRSMTWGYLESEGNRWRLENLAANGHLIPILRVRSGLPDQFILQDYVRPGKSIELKAGDKFLVGISEFQFVCLPAYDACYSESMAEDISLNN